jgi:uncharacterized membrane protein
MKPSWRVDLLSLVAIAAMFGAAVWAWPQLPDRIPIHWNVRGEVDGWGSRFAGLLGLPLATLGLYLLMRFLPFVDPGRRNYESFTRAFAAIRLTLVLFMATIYAVMLRAAFGHVVAMGTIMFLAMGVLFIVLGNFMGKLRPNWFVGVRTPWTLSSRLSWDKTHRLAGWLFVLMGAMFFVLAYFQKPWALGVVLFIDIVLMLWMVLYSYLVYRSDPHRMTPAGTSPIGDENAT